MVIREWPYVPPALVEHLKWAYPNSIPDNFLTLSDREIGSLHGRNIVIQALEARLSEQEAHVSTEGTEDS